MFPQDKDGLITPIELRHVMTNLGELLTEDEIDEMVRIVDDDGDGKINFRGTYWDHITVRSRYIAVSFL